MPKISTNPLFSTWVKNVYSLRIAQGIKSDQLPTTSPLTHQFTHTAVHNYLLIPLLVQVFAPSFSTPKISNLYLLYARLYPQSTPPINMKKKKI
jgi:hypothetical protein